MIFQDIIDIDHMQKLQNKLCRAARISTFCVSSDGSQVTQYSGDAADIAKLTQMIRKEQIEQLVRRVTADSIEDQVVEDTEYPFLKLAGVYVKSSEEFPLIWVVCGIVTDAEGVEEPERLAQEWSKVLTEREFYEVLDLLHDAAKQLLGNQLRLESVKEENFRTQSSKQKMESLLLRNEAMTQVVQLLDDDSAIESVMNKLLASVGSHLGLSSAQIFQLDAAREQMDVIAQWCNRGVISYFDQTKNQPVFAFLDTEKPLVISYDSDMTQKLRDELTELGISALICFPISIGEVTNMYVCFQEKNPKRRWTVDEIKFVSDALRVLQSILTRRIQKNSLTSSYRSLTAILDNIGSAIFVKDENTKKILFANRYLRNTFQKGLEENRLDDLLNQEGTELYYEEKGHWYDLIHHRITWVDGREVSLYSLYDITERKTYQRKIEQQAYTDFLTGLYNRMCCERDLARHIDDAKKTGRKGALLYLDLDDFKHINDGLGHQYGDILLRAISDSLKMIRGISNTCYRMGGDEFVIIVPPSEQYQVDSIIDSINAVFAKPWFLKDTDYYCTMSMGVVFFPEYGEDVQEVIKKADIAMYEAKRSGKNQLAFYSDSIDSVSTRRLDMERNMREAVLDDFSQFEVYYQPIMNVQQEGNPCVGAEALIRWHNESMGFVAPADFIPLAEYLGLIMPIGNHVLYEACEACRYWNDHGHPNYKVNVNLSVIQLLQADIVEVIEDTIKKTGIDPHHLTLEVTESLAINDMFRMQNILSKIKELGVRLALDDFGTGYSSLNHIREIPFDVIKVDQGFVKELAEDAYSQAFVKMVGELAETLGKSICVEGIETEQQLRVLGDMNILMVQGFYFDKPLPREVFEEKYINTKTKEMDIEGKAAK